MNIPVACVLTVQLDRIVVMFRSDEPGHVTMLRIAKSYPTVYETLLQEKPITCCHSQDKI